MGPPGGGRSRITQRYVRHFNVIGFVPFDKDSLGRIFSTIVQWCLGELPALLCFFFMLLDARLRAACCRCVPHRHQSDGLRGGGGDN
jgi:hypothetical protein